MDIFGSGKDDQKEKTLSNVDSAGAKKAVPDIKVVGDPDAWQVICKAWSDKEGWMKSTKAMAIGKDVLVQVSSQQRNIDGSSSMAESIVLIPFVEIKEQDETGDLTLVPRVRKY